MKSVKKMLGGLSSLFSGPKGEQIPGVSVSKQSVVGDVVNDVKRAVPVIKKVKTEKQLLNLFSKAEMRVGEITTSSYLPKNSVYYLSSVSIGEETRQVLSALRSEIPIEQMEGKVIVLCNVKSKKLVRRDSHGYILWSFNEQEKQSGLLRPDNTAKVGDRIILQSQQETAINITKQLTNMNISDILENCEIDHEGSISFCNQSLVTQSDALPVTGVKAGCVNN